MAIIDSKKQQLDLQDNIIRAIYEQGDSLKIDPAAAIITVVKELQMENSEGAQLGNTVFITHFDSDGKFASVNFLTVDTEENVRDAVDQYLQSLKNRKYVYVVFQYPDKESEDLFNVVTKRHLGRMISKEDPGGTYSTHILMNT